MRKIYKSLLEQGKVIAVDMQSIEYNPTDDSIIKKLRDWKVNVSESYLELSLKQQQQSLIGLSEIISSVLDDSKQMYYSSKSREIVSRFKDFYEVQEV